MKSTVFFLICMSFQLPSLNVRAQMPQTTPSPGSDPASVQAAKPMEPTMMSDVNRRDPFRLPQYLIENVVGRNQPPPALPSAEETESQLEKLEPLQRWNFSEYMLIGIIWDVKNPKALIRDRKNKIHVIKVNDRLGNKEGIVTAIKEGVIVVTENGSPQILKLKK